jgi:hypothetical protein
MCFKLKHFPNEKPAQFASTIKNRTTCPDFSGSRHTTKIFIKLAKPTKTMILKNFKRFKKMVLHWNRRICKKSVF